jgi:hypothetical protein
MRSSRKVKTEKLKTIMSRRCESTPPHSIIRSEFIVGSFIPDLLHACTPQASGALFPPT